MFNYHLGLAYKNIGRQKGLSLLIAATLGVGIAACMITFALIYLMSKDPLPDKSQRIFHVQLDNWKLSEAAIQPDLPPEEVTWRDARNIVNAKQAKYQAASALTWGMVTPDKNNPAPFLGIIRATHGEFFNMFDVPFLYGQGWQNSHSNQAEFVVVLSRKTNDRVFSGLNSVGKTLPMLGKLFTVVGVLDDWHTSPKFYDMTIGTFSEPEDLYIPLQTKAELELPHGGNSNCWETDLGEQYSAFINSECVNLHLWVELEHAEDITEFQNYLHQYVEQQRQFGRFARPTNNPVLNLKQWLTYKKVVDSDIYLFFYLALLFLVVCLFNAASLISTKFNAKSREIALRRALGANQQTIFKQCLTETVILGLLGACIGLLLSTAGLEGIKKLYPSFQAFISIDISLMLLTVTLSVLSSVLAGLVPTIRVCRLTPAMQLK